jgi:hypothetical protein
VMMMVLLLLAVQRLNPLSNPLLTSPFIVNASTNLY